MTTLLPDGAFVCAYTAPVDRAAAPALNTENNPATQAIVGFMEILLIGFAAGESLKDGWFIPRGRRYEDLSRIACDLRVLNIEELSRETHPGADRATVVHEHAYGDHMAIPRPLPLSNLLTRIRHPPRAALTGAGPRPAVIPVLSVCLESMYVPGTLMGSKAG
jgi:hypothetical protein